VGSRASWAGQRCSGAVGTAAVAAGEGEGWRDAMKAPTLPADAAAEVAGLVVVQTVQEVFGLQ
jgi:hypothetical protein